MVTKRKKSSAMTKQEAEDEIRYLRSLIETHLKPRYVDNGNIKQCPLCKAEVPATHVGRQLVHKKHCYFARGQTALLLCAGTNSMSTAEEVGAAMCDSFMTLYQQYEDNKTHRRTQTNGDNDGHQEEGNEEGFENLEDLEDLEDHGPLSARVGSQGRRG